MLYELFAVVRPGQLHEVKEVARTTGSLILSSGGVIRGITNWGQFLLPKPTRKHQMRQHSGHYFIMRFDSSGETQQMVRTTLGLDPRMVKFGVVRLGSTLEAIKGVQGSVEWGGGEEEGSGSGLGIAGRGEGAVGLERGGRAAVR